MSNQTDSSGCIGIFGIIGVVFIVLKLTKVIAWSWWWVLCPFWGGFILALLLFSFIAIVGVVASK